MENRSQLDELYQLEKRKRTVRNLKKFLPLYIMMLPVLTYFFVFRYVPMYGISIAFKDYNIMKGIFASQWANPLFKHFRMFFLGPYAFQLIRNTMLISLYKLIFGILPPIILAVALNECRNLSFKRFIQTLSYMPHFLSWVIIYGILYAFLSESAGLINRFILTMGGEKIPFLYSTNWFRPILVASDIWQNCGWGAIIYLAAIAGINPNLYEAAQIDGATRWQRIRLITVPSIGNTIVLMLILKLGNIMNAGFEQVYALYNVHVYEVGDIIDTWVFRTGLEQLNFSLATAVGLFKSFIGLILVVSTNAIARRSGGGNLW